MRRPDWQSEDGTVAIHCGDALDVLREVESESVHCCVTSPPYWGLRDYGVEGQYGLESTPAEYVAKMVEVFREVRRVLNGDGTLWLNLGDSYAAQRGGTAMPAETIAGGVHGAGDDDAHRGRRPITTLGDRQDESSPEFRTGPVPHRNARKSGLKHKDLVGIPWRVAFALQQDGWYLRQDIIWHKPNPMPESVRDRCTKAHEYLFLLSKSERYYYDAGAIADKSLNGGQVQDYTEAQKNNGADPVMMATRPRGRQIVVTETRNRRSVWTIPTQPFKEAHFATFPPALAEPCILAGCPQGGTVLDPFGGSGTTGMVAAQLGRKALLIELNPANCEMARRRIVPALAQPDMFVNQEAEDAAQ